MKDLYLKCFLYVFTLVCFFQSCSSGAPVFNTNEIDVATAMNNSGEIKLSDYFTEIRYIPLETTEEGLIGRYPQVQLVEDKILIATAQKQSLLFNDVGFFFVP